MTVRGLLALALAVLLLVVVCCWCSARQLVCEWAVSLLASLVLQTVEPLRRSTETGQGFLRICRLCRLLPVRCGVPAAGPTGRLHLLLLGAGVQWSTWCDVEAL